MAPKISKTVYMVTVFHDKKTPPYSAEVALEEMNDGAMVGSVEHMYTVDVPKKNLKNELIDIGNDGKFFEDYI